jgi:hypothetical protein
MFYLLHNRPLQKLKTIPRVFVLQGYTTVETAWCLLHTEHEGYKKLTAKKIKKIRNKKIKK